MATDRRTVSFKSDPETVSEIGTYKKRRGLEFQSEAVEELVEIGLQEARAPILYRIKDYAIESAWYLSLIGIVTVVVGVMTTALTPGHGIQIAAVLVAIGAALIASVELVRVLGGHSHLALVVPTRGEKQ